jgi:hypothetical protein
MGLISETKFTFDPNDQHRSALFYWAKQRYVDKHLDFYFDDNSTNVMLVKVKNLFIVLKDWPRVKQFIDFFFEEDDYAQSLDWDFNYFTSARALNKFLGKIMPKEDLDWWREHSKQLIERQRADGTPKHKLVTESQLVDWHEAQEDYAANLGVDSEAIKRPFENDSKKEKNR